LLHTRREAARRDAYNARMHPFIRVFLPFLLCCAILPARGQGAPVAPPAGHQAGEFRYHLSPRDMTPEEREAWREERRQRREQWRQMSPEERYQLRRDIRDAGREIYPRGPRRHAVPPDFGE